MSSLNINTRHIYAFLLALVMPLAALCAEKSYYLAGIVRDSVNLEPLPFASVSVPGAAEGAVCNDKGIFELAVPVDATELQVTCLGFRKKVVPISKRAINMYDIHLSPETKTLKEVVVTKKKYSKKNNPAVAFAEMLKKKGNLTDPRRNDYYNYDKYQITTFALNNFAEKDENSWMFKKFPFLWEYVDTSEVSGTPILNVMSKEKSSEVHYRKSPKAEKEVVTGLRQAGLDEIVDANSMQTFFDDVLREIDLYDNDITLLRNRFVSPLSRIASDFYKFYLTDTVEVNGESCIVLSFYPHNPASFGFNGQIYVPVADSTMFIRKVTMRSPRDINLNFIDNIIISQEFERAPDGSRLKTRDDVTVELKVLSSKSGMYARRNIAYTNHNFDAPPDSVVFDELAATITIDNALSRSEDFWAGNRQLQVTGNETGVDRLMTQLRSVPLYYWSEKLLKIFFTGYIPLGKWDKVQYGPVNTTVSFNNIEGVRLRAGGVTTAKLNPHWFGRGYVAWGTKDHRWKYLAEVEYSFDKKEYHPQQFPVHSLRLSTRYDIDQLGQKYLFTNADNIVLSLKRQKDEWVTYNRTSKLEYTMELENNFSLFATVQNVRQYATHNVEFVNGYGTRFDHYDENSLIVKLRYAPGEKFFQTRSQRIHINYDAPEFSVTHTFAPRRFVGSAFAVNKTQASVWKRFWFSAFGYADVLVSGGHVWSRSPFPNLFIANANLSYTIQPESFSLMNAMEFINDSYAALDFTYGANGALFNCIPYVKKLKLREIFTFRALWGHLSHRNDPALNPDLYQFPSMANVTRMTNRPYMEVGVGLDNIFGVLRLDYVWRLSYLDVPYPIDRRGLRVALRVNF